MIKKRHQKTGEAALTALLVPITVIGDKAKSKRDIHNVLYRKGKRFLHPYAHNKTNYYKAITSGQKQVSFGLE
jgi:hypothetical protein